MNPSQETQRLDLPPMAFCNDDQGHLSPSLSQKQEELPLAEAKSDDMSTQTDAVTAQVQGLLHR